MSEDHGWDVYPLVFTRDFLFGACVSDYQHFGNTVCDLEPTDGARHMERFVEDFEIARGLGLTCFRSTVEWSRVEPRRGEFSAEAFSFYKRYYGELRSRGIRGFATLHHFTNPPWIHQLGGWLSAEVRRAYVEYVRRVGQELGDALQCVLLFNEPANYAYLAYMKGEGGLPPYRKDRRQMLAALDNIVGAMAEAADALRSTGYRGKIGFTHLVPNTRPKSALSVGARLHCSLAWGPMFYDVIDGLAGAVDFVGLDYFTLSYVDGAGSVVASKTDPQGLTRILMDVWLRYRLPLAVTGNGFPTRNHSLKTKYLVEHLVAVAKALEAGVPVFAYCWWSFLHGYEWGYGYRPFFALVDVDQDYRRTPTPAAAEYSKIVATKTITVEQQLWARSQPDPGYMRDWRLDADAAEAKTTA